MYSFTHEKSATCGNTLDLLDKKESDTWTVRCDIESKVNICGEHCCQCGLGSNPVGDESNVS